MSKNNRPGIVSVLGILGLISGAMQILGGMFIALDGDRVNDFSQTGLNDTGLIWYGVFTMALGAFVLFLASSILSGQRWTRVWYAVVGSINIVVGAWLVLTHSGEARWTGLFTAIIWVIILQLLFNDKSDKYFDD